MIDFNVAEDQGAGGKGPIPDDSIVPLRVTIRPPSAGKEGRLHTLLCRSSKGNEYLDMEFEVIGSYGGRKVWQNFTVAGSDQAAKISMRTLRAIVESARGISPTDSSPAASEGRKLSDWADFNGMTFLAKLGVVVEQSQKDGNWYVNNTIKRIITPDDTAYSVGEMISDKPLPELPAHGEPADKRGSAAGPGTPFATGPAVATAGAATAGPVAKNASGVPLPGWAMK